MGSDHNLHATYWKRLYGHGCRTAHSFGRRPQYVSLRDESLAEYLLGLWVCVFALRGMRYGAFAFV